MKKTSLLLAIASIALTILPSCKKPEQEKLPITETVNTTVVVNETYSYTLPSSDDPEPYTIVKQSEHSSTSVIGKNAAGNFIYNYTPTANFNGSDVVVISNEKVGHGPCNHPDCNHQEHHHNNKSSHHGNCQHNGKQKHIITINFTIADKATNVTASNASDK